MLADLSNTEIENLIDEWIHNRKYREVAKSRFLDGLTYEKLSEIYDLSVTQTKTIVKRTKEILDSKCPVVVE